MFAVWQNRFNYIDANILARMLLLYKDYNKELSSTVGISIEDIYIILLSIMLVYKVKEKYYSKKICLLILI